MSGFSGGSSLIKPAQLPSFYPGGRLLPNCKAATMDPPAVTATNSGGTTGQLWFTSIMLPAGPVNNGLTALGGTGETGGSHAWYALMDLGFAVRAVTADQTGATAFGPGFASIGLPWTQQYVIPSPGRYLFGVCVVATGMPNFVGQGQCLISQPNGTFTYTDSWTGTLNSGLTTPPALGTVMSGLANVGGNYNIYAEVN